MEPNPKLHHSHAEIDFGRGGGAEVRPAAESYDAADLDADACRVDVVGEVQNAVADFTDR